MITALITLSRAVAIWNYSLAKKIFTWKKTILYYAVLWIYSVGFLSLPLFSIWGGFEYEERSFSCTFVKHQWTSDNTTSPHAPVKKYFIGISFATIVLILISRSNTLTFQNIAR